MQITAKSRFDVEIELAKACGNIVFATNAGLRLAVSHFDAGEVQAYLLNSMGISAKVTPQLDGLTIHFDRLDRHGPSKVMSALDSAFNCAYLIAGDRRKAIKVFST